MTTVRHLIRNKGRVWTFAPEEPALRALKLMAEKKIGAVLIMEGEKVVGIFSERDFARAAAANPSLSPNTPLQELMTHEVYYVGPDQTVFESLRLMADKDIGALVVVQDDKIVGMLSERDYARKIILLGKASKDTLVKEIMSFPVFTIHPDQTIEEAMEMMTHHRIRHLPVVEDDHLIGMVSIGDAVRDIIYRQRETIKEMSERLRG